MNTRSVSNPRAEILELVDDVAGAKLAAGTRDEVVDPLLWLEPFIEVVVPLEHDADVLVQEHRLERFPQSKVGAMASAR